MCKKWLVWLVYYSNVLSARHFKHDRTFQSIITIHSFKLLYWVLGGERDTTRVEDKRISCLNYYPIKMEFPKKHYDFHCFNLFLSLLLQYWFCNGYVNIIINMTGFHNVFNWSLILHLHSFIIIRLVNYSVGVFFHTIPTHFPFCFNIWTTSCLSYPSTISLQHNIWPSTSITCASHHPSPNLSYYTIFLITILS